MSNSGAPLWVGIDLGTQSVKVTIVDDDGTVHGSASRPLSGEKSSPGRQQRHEQQPGDWIAGTRAACAQAVVELGRAARSGSGSHTPKDIRGVATCSTSGTIAVADPVAAGGRFSTPALMYDDARAAGLEADVTEAAPRLWNSLGYRVQPTWALSKLLWLQRHDRLGAAASVAHQTDVISEAMVGHPVATDWSSALKSGYDLIARRWPTEAFAALGIDPGVLPEVVVPGDQLGRTCADWERATGIPAGTPVLAGMTDGCAAQLGAGALGVGDWHTVLGTTLVLKGVSPVIVRDTAGAVYSHRSPDGSNWLPGGASSIGAGALSTLLPGTDLTTLTRRAAGRWTTAAALPVAYPLIGRGERFPFVRPDAVGFVIVDGSEREFTADVELAPEDRLAAVFAGVACTERLCFETLAGVGAPLTGRLTSSGGGSSSESWVRLRANTLARPIALPRSAEASLGMAILAAWGAGPDSGGGNGSAAGSAASSLVEVARRMSRVNRVIDPDPGGIAMMAEYYDSFTGRLRAKGWLDQLEKGVLA